MERLNYRNSEGNLFYIDADNIFIVPAWYNKIYTKTLTDEYPIVEKIKENADGYFDFSKNMIDVGAYVGEYSALLDFNHNFCFEPNKKSAALLGMNLYLREKADKSDIYNVCVSDQNGVIDYDGFFCKGDVQSYYRPEECGEAVPTECRTLDSYNFQNIGFIKIDVEGFEENVLRGGLITIVSNQFPPILFECWHPGAYNDMKQEKCDSLFNLLETLGYVIFKDWGNDITHLAVHKTHLNK